MELFVGVDWAEDHHDLCVMDAAGRVRAKGRVSDDLAGVVRVHDLIASAVPVASHGDAPSASRDTSTATVTSHTLATTEIGAWTTTSVTLTLTKPSWATGPPSVVVTTASAFELASHGADPSSSSLTRTSTVTPRRRPARRPRPVRRLVPRRRTRTPVSAR